MEQGKTLFDRLGVGIGLILLALFAGHPVALWAQEQPRIRQRKPAVRTPSPRILTPKANRDLRSVDRRRGNATPTAGESGITLRNNQLSLDVRNQSLRTIIERIATQGEIYVRHLEETPDPRISLRFTDVPVVDGLKRLFRVAELPGYLLVVEGEGEQARVQKILFLPGEQEAGRKTARVASRVPRRRPAPPRRPPRSAARPPAEKDEDSKDARETTEGQSVFEMIKSNTTARRLLSQLVHPNEQVRERALERLVRLVGEDEKQAELLEFLEPLMEDLASEERTVREEARTEVRKLLRR